MGVVIVTPLLARRTQRHEALQLVVEFDRVHGLGEEGVEAAVAVLSGSGEELVGEAADILFHLIVALNARDVPLADVLAELDRREGVSGIEEKASRSA